MCLAIPGRVIAVDRTDPAVPFATVDFEGLIKTAQLLYVPEADVGDYVIVQAGFAIRTVPAAEALEALALARSTSVEGSSTRSDTQAPGVAAGPGA